MHSGIEVPGCLAPRGWRDSAGTPCGRTCPIPKPSRGPPRGRSTPWWSSMILTDPALAYALAPRATKSGFNQTEYAERRVAHGRAVAAALPFPVAFYWSVYAPECPGRHAQRKTNARGVALSHFQIWSDFARGGERSFLGEQEQRGHDDVFDISRMEGLNGSDILTVFEDDAKFSASNLTAILAVEFANMNTDILFLGWCHDKQFAVPLCTHAYALTRQAAQKLVKYFDICSRFSVDKQLLKLSRFANLFTWRRAFPESYTRVSESTIQGIFHQNKDLKSFKDIST